MLSRSRRRTIRELCWCGAWLLVVGAAPLAAQRPSADVDSELRVLHHTPSDSARSSEIITVAFDRPVAGMLDRSVDLSKIFHISPSVAGTLGWRDPATIRFVPSTPLTPGNAYEIVVDTTFAAMDGSRLLAPYRFHFRVPGPRVLAAIPGIGQTQWAPPTDTFRLVFSAPVDSTGLARLVAGTEVRLSGCRDAQPIPLRLIGERAITPDLPLRIRATRLSADTVADQFRRVIELVATLTLPDGCQAQWLVPSRIRTRSAISIVTDSRPARVSMRTR